MIIAFKSKGRNTFYISEIKLCSYQKPERSFWCSQIFATLSPLKLIYMVVFNMGFIPYQNTTVGTVQEFGKNYMNCTIFSVVVYCILTVSCLSVLSVLQDVIALIKSLINVEVICFIFASSHTFLLISTNFWAFSFGNSLYQRDLEYLKNVNMKSQK